MTACTTTHASNVSIGDPHFLELGVLGDFLSKTLLTGTQSTLSDVASSFKGFCCSSNILLPTVYPFLFIF